MKTISIAVEPEIQVAFEQANDEDKQALGALISSFFKDRLASKNLVEVMREIGDRAEKRGLTPEILNELLNDEDEG
ncbi:hypothetical protein [Pseudanabaena sp. ABRG5-3]|uniref:hypothetical protein n=1 Tax=Pseudanabaena sp. ABRG5-3 TaxID=685565 RepID=UPI000DC72C39|nr:hypothetical protein [Pseudanabaena sp. ABRG5-3]BBC24579.1 hypothetical protein ABRG53_2322 [Pseudanabaena sp. ABRG5-3]